ncbi:succinylglutamate desuccinylase/aspartoacylase family protein [Solirubrobacter sp. CPCC 204708]|uniref:M14 family zinc carboxypeptidase n=1 Tax=Solirubrobacter deserti TaxID=2282478 RepID=A0ABT4RLB2_9ACTN|nr:M14 family zinc carboxypeptidase [Solirubrobacter deserti]MBE2320460.1 succinylglutamate desuccinylase/aspartoacylase family protein [Solirubrobacter deserti]MDA0139349.1 M14 family zinc carboxypeptidase [Solirubrobacter deserti]
MVAALGVAMLLFPAAASAQDPEQVTGVTVTQDVGFTTLKWNPVAGATDYQIERAPAGTPEGTAGTVVGVWQPQRTITPDKPAFADSGYKLGDSFRWRVRARFGTGTSAVLKPYSAPVEGTTLGHPGPAELLTAWEKRDTATDPNIANDYTTTAEEETFTAALDAASDRFRRVELTRTIQNRPLDLYILGYPKPPDTAAEISARPTFWVNCNVHGNEASGRETCFTMARQLAFTQDPAILDMLSKITVLIMPSSNPDGRALNQRGNSTGQDLNRDHALIEQAETKAQAQLMRDYTPDVSVDNHEGDSEDLPILTARHLNVYEPLFEEGKSLVNEWMYGAAAQSGWWMGPYSTGGDSHEGILRNTSALKNSVGLLGEARAAPGTTRPAEGGTNTRANENRKAYAHLWENWEAYRYFYAKLNQITALNKASEAFQTRQTLNRTVLRGSYPWPLVPHVGANPDDQPDVDTPLAARILDPAPCGYYMTQADYEAPRTSISPTPIQAGSIASRLAIHGIKVVPWGQGVLVPLKQPLGGLVAPMLDAAGVLPMLRTAVRYYGSCEGGTVSGTVPATLSLTLGSVPSLGAFQPGVDAEYVAAADATVTSTAGDAMLSISDNGPSPGHLVNGAFALAQPLQAQAGTGGFFPLRASPLNLYAYSAPVSNDVVTLAFKQVIGRTDPLRTGTYSKTLTFTLSTTNP